MALQELTVDLLKEQLKIRAIVDKRREANGKALVRTPPKKDAAGGEGGRAWLILKLQSLLKLEFAEGLLAADPNDLPEGDRGCAAAKQKGRGDAQKPKARNVKTPQAKRPRKQQQQHAQANDSSDESSANESSADDADGTDDEGDVYRVEAILDQRDSNAADKKRMGWALGTELYLVVRYAKHASHSTSEQSLQHTVASQCVLHAGMGWLV